MEPKNMDSTPEPNIIVRMLEKLEDLPLDSPKEQVISVIVAGVMLTMSLLSITGLVYFGYLLGSR